LSRASRPTRLIEETARAKTIVLDVPGWAGHVAGRNVDVRLTAEDGYQAERSYAIASSLESAKVALTVERIDDGEVSVSPEGRASRRRHVGTAPGLGAASGAGAADAGPACRVASAPRLAYASKR
jgi:ferredoxin-NADP reductase